MSYSLLGPPAGAAIDPASGAFSWIPDHSQVGQHMLLIQVSENGQPAMSAQTQVPFTVNAVNYTLSALVVGQGSVMQDPDQPEYVKGSTVSLQAIPMPGYVFYRLERRCQRHG